ncbi:MAG: hypothetical protein ABW022_14400 [Actinoplanes sp.]
MPTDLHIGIDREKIVVSPYALKPRTGRVRRVRAGSVTETRPLPPSGRDREDRVTFAARLSLPLLFTGAVLYAAGLPWWLPALAAIATIGTVWHRQARAAQAATFAMPRDEESRVLWSPRERAAFEHAVGVSRRIRRTWPALSGLVDPAAADHSLTNALDDLATALVRRQEIRRLRTELSSVRHDDVPADSPVVRALAEQRSRVEELWQQTGEQADHLLRSLDAIALAGETFLHEQRIGATVRDAELILAGLTASAAPAGSGPDLADRTAAVLSAYRELAAADPR